MQENFSKRLKKVREEKGLSQAELAKVAGFQPAAISHFETGQRKPSFDNLKKLADALAVSIDYLLGRDIKRSDSLTGQLFRNFEKLSETDQQMIKDVAERLAQKSDGQ